MTTMNANPKKKKKSLFCVVGFYCSNNWCVAHKLICGKHCEQKFAARMHATCEQVRLPRKEGKR